MSGEQNDKIQNGYREHFISRSFVPVWRILTEITEYKYSVHKGQRTDVHSTYLVNNGVGAEKDLIIV